MPYSPHTERGEDDYKVSGGRTVYIKWGQEHDGYYWTGVTGGGYCNESESTEEKQFIRTEIAN